MKGLRFLLLGLAICLASGVKAQFNDSADDIYYYVEYENGQVKDNGRVLIFNFDGQTACVLGDSFIDNVKNNIKNKSDYYEEKVETSEYDYHYTYHGGTAYVHKGEKYLWTLMNGHVEDGILYRRYVFSSDRSMMYSKAYRDIEERWSYMIPNHFPIQWKSESRKYTKDDPEKTFKRVEKSFFRVGRSRTPSGTMHE